MFPLLARAVSISWAILDYGMISGNTAFSCCCNGHYRAEVNDPWIPARGHRHQALRWCCPRHNTLRKEISDILQSFSTTTHQ